MQKLFAILFIIIALPSLVYGQAPEAMKYQAVVRDNTGALIANQAVNFQIKILEGSTSGPSVLVETHLVTTSDLGLANLQIGRGNNVSGDFSTIDWPNNSYFMEVGMDISGGSNFVSLGTSELLSVPYALHAKTARTVEVENQTLELKNDTLSISSGNFVVLPQQNQNLPGGRQTVVFSGDITDAQAIQKFQDEVGSKTQVIAILNTSQLTSIDLPGVTDLVEVRIQNNISLQTVNAPDLINIYGNVDIENNPTLTTLNFPELKYVADILTVQQNIVLPALSFPKLEEIYAIRLWSGTVINNIDAPNLKEITDEFTLTFIPLSNGINMPALETLGELELRKCGLTSFDLPALKTVTDLYIFDCDSLQTISFALLENQTQADKGLRIEQNSKLMSISAPQLQSVYEVTIELNDSLQTIDFSGLQTLNQDNFEIITNGKLHTVDLSSLTTLIPATSFDFDMYQNALTSSTVNSILARLVVANPQLGNCEIRLNAQTPAAPPTGQGLTDKSTLISNGNSVFTD